MNYTRTLFLCLVLLVPTVGCEYTPVGPGPADPVSWETSGRHVVAFTADWCRQCQMDKPSLYQLRSQGVSVIEIDVDDQPELAQKYGAGKLPTYLVMQDGQIEARCISLATLLGIIKVALWVFPLFT